MPTLVLFWYWFPTLLRNSGTKHQNDPLVGAETVRHSSAYIILYLSIPIYQTLHHLRLIEPLNELIPRCSIKVASPVTQQSHHTPMPSCVMRLQSHGWRHFDRKSRYQFLFSHASHKFNCLSEHSRVPTPSTMFTSPCWARKIPLFYLSCTWFYFSTPGSRTNDNVRGVITSTSTKWLVWRFGKDISIQTHFKDVF